MHLPRTEGPHRAGPVLDDFIIRALILLVLLNFLSRKQHMVYRNGTEQPQIEICPPVHLRPKRFIDVTSEPLRKVQNSG